MDKRIIILCLFVGINICIKAQQQVDKYEYWFNRDFSEAKEVVVTPSSTLNITTTIPTTGLPLGLQTLHTRFRQTDGMWSSASSQFFMKVASAESETNLIDGYEYWFDNEYASKTSQLVTPQSNVTLVTDITSNNMPAGLHTFNMRFRSVGGGWSAVNTQFFMKLSATDSNNNLLNGYEYWFDNNYSGKKRQNITSQDDITLITDIVTNELADGLHTLNIRFQSVGGGWSASNTQFFIKQPSTDNDNNLLDGYEYWFDNNFAGKVRQNTTPQGDITLVTDIASSELPVGLHTFNIRFKSVDGNWSAVTTRFFIKPDISILGENKIVAYEYWCNESEDAKTRINISPVNPLEIDNQLVEINNLAQIATPDSFLFVPDVFGNAKIHYLASNKFIIRFLDQQGKWSSPSVHLFSDGNGVDVIADTLQSGIPVTKLKPAADEIHFYKLNALAGDSLIWKTDLPCAIQVFDPFGVKVYEANGEESRSFNGVRVKRDGVYHVLLHSVNSSSNQITLDYKHIHKYAVLGYDVKKVGNQGISTIQFTGNGFDKFTKIVFETKDKEIVPDTILCSDLSTLSAIVDFTNKVVGVYDVKVFFTDTTFVFENGLEVESFIPIELDVSIIGASNFRIGTPITYSITVKNNGNTTAYQVPLNIKIIANTESAIQNLKLSDNIQKPKIPENIDLSSFSEEDQFAILEYYNNFQDIHHFFHFHDKETGKYIRTNDFFIESIAPNSDFSIILTVNPTSSIDIEAIVPQSWQTFNNQNNKTQLKSNMPCCLYNSFDCILSIAELYDAYPFSSCIYGLARTGISFAVSEACDDSETNSKNVAEGTIGLHNTIVSAALGCMEKEINKLNIFWKFTDKLRQVLEVSASCSDVIKSWVSGDCYPKPKKDNVHSSGVTSYDPNDKIGYRSPSGSTYFKEDITNMTYIINFENDPEKATAAAQDVYITDTLDMAKFNIHSFRAGYVRVNDKIKHASFDAQNHSWDIDMRPEMNLITRVNLSLDKAKGIARWHFSSIDPMTDKPVTDVFAGFLPPNDETGRGQGSVSFNIDLKKDLPDDSEVSNSAEIVFDYNEPILTPQWTNKKDIVAPTSYMLDPVIIDENTARISWGGEDNKNGSGIYRYNLFVKEEGEDYFNTLLEATDQTNINFSYETDVKYHLYVTAVDSAGNIEVKTTIPDKVFTNKKTQDFSVTISRKWDDVLICDNTENLFTEYKWFKDDVAIPGANRQFYQEKGGLNGNYYVQVTTTDGRIGNSNVIEASGNKKQVKVYPNPIGERTEYTVEIISGDSDLKGAILQVVSVNGQIVTKRTNLQQKMRLNGLTSGMYVIWVQFANGESLSQKLLVK